VCRCETVLERLRVPLWEGKYLFEVGFWMGLEDSQSPEASSSLLFADWYEFYQVAALRVREPETHFLPLIHSRCRCFRDMVQKPSGNAAESNLLFGAFLGQSQSCSVRDGCHMRSLRSLRWSAAAILWCPDVHVAIALSAPHGT
jgi:hypothetical protein